MEIKFQQLEKENQLDFETLLEDLQSEQYNYDVFENGVYAEDLKKSKVLVHLVDENGNIFYGHINMTVGLLRDGKEFLLYGSLEGVD